MGKLIILASGDTNKTQARARGKLFEKLMSEVLRHYGYKIDRITNINYAGMEIDIEGKAIATKIPLYAECKCYHKEIDSPKLQKFFGNYMTRWFKNKKCQGLFIALPGVNSHAKGFYRENCEEHSEFTLCLYEEEQVLDAILDTHELTNPDTITRLITEDIGKPGDWVLLYTDKGFYWIQYVIPPGGGIPTGIAVFDATGIPLSDRATMDYLKQLYSELNDFNEIVIGSTIPARIQSMPKDTEEVVEVRGSSECFEYQFPAAPQFFVGRKPVLKKLDSFISKVLNNETSSRGILFEANSGWGKSSVVLASVARLQKMGHFAVAIDSRSASSSQFILRVVEYAIHKFGDFNGLISRYDKLQDITGFDGAIQAIIGIGEELKKDNKLMFIFLDQFENIFIMQNALKRITDLLLKICDAQTSVVLGFSWKTDIIGLTSEFPYKLRDDIRDSSEHIALETFSEVETTALLDRLSKELRARLRKDLIFFLSEFSQGYPWLLKKLCAHVKAQRETGVPQSDIAKSLLNIEELFQEDLRGLSSEEEEVLYRISRASPISILDLGEEFKSNVVQSLVHRRLVVRIGKKYDIYWDIFRDYLNSGSLPMQENYILRSPVRSVISATKLLLEAGGKLTTDRFQDQAFLSEKSFYNVAKDMRLLGLATVDKGDVSLRIKLPLAQKEFEDAIGNYLNKRLRRNRLIWRLSEILEERVTLYINDVSNILRTSCPYITATQQTWLTYARIFTEWMDVADIAYLDRKNKTLNRYDPGTEIRERNLLLVRRRRGSKTLLIQYSPVVEVAKRLVWALQKDGKVDWTGFSKSTIFKALSTLEDFNFINKKTTFITVQQIMFEFVLNPDKRSSIFAESALKLESFAIFIKILEEHKDTGYTLLQLGVELREKLGVDWKDSTSEVNSKIMLDWARHTDLAPGVFAKSRKGPRKGWKKLLVKEQLTIPKLNV